MPVSEKHNPEGLIEQVLQLNLKLVKPGYAPAGSILENESLLKDILTGLGNVSEQLEQKSRFIQERTERLNTVLDVLLKFTMMDFSEKLPLSEEGDEIDAIALGLNTLTDELDRHIRRLKESEEHFRLLVQGSKEYSIYMMDVNGYVLSWNPGAERIKQYKADEIIGKHFSTFYTDEEAARDEPVENLKHAAESGHWEGEGWRKRKDGSLFWSDASITALHDEHGNLKGFSKITRDSTLKRRRDQQIMETTNELLRSNKQLEQFVYIASHDLQEPLRTIANYVSLFEEDYHENMDGTALNYFKRIVNATTRMQTLITGLLEYARVGGTQEMVAVNCNILLVEVLHELEGAIKESAARVIAGALPVIYGHYFELKSLFMNLVGNALKFRRKDLAPIVEISAEEKPDEWIFAVKDNGIGIEPQYQEKIFLIFQKLNKESEYPGTGIGLAHGMKVVEAHRGRLWVESEPGKGSTFYFSIPKALRE